MLAKNSKIFIQYLSKRTVSNRAYQLNELNLKEYGNLDASTLNLNSRTLNDSEINLKKDEVFVKLIAAPINPADVNIIQGKYAALPVQLPAIIGNEGLFEVVKVNEESKKFKVGDWALPIQSGWGTWRSHAINSESSFVKIPNTLNKQACATLMVNPCTAFRMLNDFMHLKPNDTIIQNGANSGVGQAVIQLASHMNVNVVNIVRKRENQQELTDYLTQLGAKHVFTEEDLRKSPELTVDLWKKIPRPKLAFNCVGGKATTDLIRLYTFLNMGCLIQFK